MKIVVSGKKVILRDVLPARPTWELMRKAAAEPETIPSWETMVEQLQLFVESWEFEGDPKDPKTYEALNYYDLMAIYNTSNEIFTKRMNETKNLPKPSS